MKKLHELTQQEQQFRIAVYKRYRDMWIHWSPHILIIPAVAAAINLLGYAELFDMEKMLNFKVKFLGLGVMVLLNLALTIGIWRTRYLQKVFGERLQEMEEDAGVPPVKLYKFSASMFYALIMTMIFLVSLLPFISLVSRVR